MVTLLIVSTAQAQNGRGSGHAGEHGNSGSNHGGPHAAEASATLMFEEEGYDLETESAVAFDPEYGFTEETDFVFAYNADTDPHVRLFQEPDVWIAFFVDTAFDKVACNDVKHVSFTPNLIDEPVYSGDTIVLITADDNYYKIGNLVENEDFTVTFDYALMDCPQ